MDDDEIQQPLFDHEEMARAATQTAPALKGDGTLDEMDDELRAALTASDNGDLPPEREREVLDLLATRNDAWLAAHADPITTDEFRSLFKQLKLAVPDIPHDPSKADDDHLLLLSRSLWKEHRVMLASNNRFYRVRSEPPSWLMGLLGLVDDQRQAESQTLAKRPPRRSIAPAFMLGGRKGIGRISSSQISDALFEACIAPKSEWDATAKHGWPRYCSRHGNTEIAFTLRPEVADLKNIAAQRAMMEQFRDELSVRDWDSIAALMAQVLTEGRPDASAFVYADTILDYRLVKRKRDENKHSAGHQHNMRVEVADSIQRLSHLYVTTETLKVRRLTSRGKVEYDTVDWNEKVLHLQGNATRRDDDAELAWQYNFGQWFTTFLEKPNRFVAYILQRALSYHPTKQQWAKQLAHYLTLEIRKNADNGRELRRTVGELLDKAGIPDEPRYPNKAKDRLEGAVRILVKDGIFRIEHNGQLLDAGSPEIDTWTATSQKLPARNWLAAFKRETMVFRADPETEKHYDDEIRRAARAVPEKGHKADTIEATAS